MILVMMVITKFKGHALYVSGQTEDHLLTYSLLGKLSTDKRGYKTEGDGFKRQLY